MNRNKCLYRIIPYLLGCFLLFFAHAAGANQKLKVILDWFPNPSHAPIFVAKERGLFEKYGLDVEIITPADPNDPPKWIAMQKGDLALDYQPHVLTQIARGLPIQQVGTLINRPLNCLVVLQQGPVKKLTDLRGKEIAYSAPEIDLLILKTMLQKQNIGLQEVSLINVHYDLTQALLSKKITAAMGMMRNFELIQLKLLGHPGRAFFPEDYGVPSYSELVFIAHKKHITDDRFQRFFNALNEARQSLLTNPEKSWQEFVKANPMLNNNLNKQSWLATLNLFANNFQTIDVKQCENIASYLSNQLKIPVTKEACNPKFQIN